MNSMYSGGDLPPMMTQKSILSERVVEHEIKVPKKVIKEEIVEKVVIVPEKVVREEIVETTEIQQERIIEVARPIITEKYVEVPQIEYREVVKQVPKVIYQDVTKQVPKIEVREKIVEVPRTVYKERYVEVPDIEYVDEVTERIVEVPVYTEEVVVRKVSVPQYVEKPVPNHVKVEVPNHINQNIPLPVEAITTYEYLLPKLKAKTEKIAIPIFAPRFVEVPVPEELLDPSVVREAEELSMKIASLAAMQAPSLTEIENLVKTAKAADFHQALSPETMHNAIEESWRTGRLARA